MDPLVVFPVLLRRRQDRPERESGWQARERWKWKLVVLRATQAGPGARSVEPLG